MKFTFKLLVPVCLSLNVFSQHNSDYIQYIFNGLLLNPAYAGSQDALNLTGLYRKQWIGVEAAPETVSFAAHAPFKNKKVNLGLIALNDKYGVFNHTHINAVYAYRFIFADGNLSFGIQAGIDSYTSNWNKLHTLETNDPSFTSNSQRSTIPNAGFGTYYYNKRFFLGAASPDLLNGNFSKYRTLLFHTGYLFNVGENFKIKPALLVKHIFNSPFSTNASATFYWKDIIGIGAGYTFNTSAIAFIDLKINDQLRFGYGYDHTMTKLNTYSAGSHEVMLRYLFRYKVESSSTRYF